MNVAIVALVGAAFLACRGPRGRPAAAVASRSGPGPRRPQEQRRSRAAVPGLLRRRRAPTGRERDLAVVVGAVVAQLRAGADPGTAWSLALHRRGGVTVAPGVEELLALAGPGRPSAGHRAQAAAVVAAGRLAAELGAPLAPVLERVELGLVAQAEAAGERSAALAGPRATALVLTLLPALGLVLGVAAGADPVAVVLDGGVGTAALGLGVGLVLIGRWWIWLLVRSAARAGSDR